MPELPEVEVLRRTVEPHLVGARLGTVEVHDRRLREPVDVRRLRRVEGRTVTAVRRRSKYLLIDTEGDLTLVVHLGMSGRLTIVPSQAPRELHEHVAIALPGARRLRFRDPRRFGLVLATATSTLAADPHFAGLGVEPLEPGFDGAVLRAAAAGRRGPVKAFLMDARIVVGVGNIYASESLFAAGIHPSRSVARIAAPRWEALADAVRRVLDRAIVEGGTTLNDFADAEGRSGEFQNALAVYDREGQPCERCGTPIRRSVHAGRSTYHCPRCQR